MKISQHPHIKEAKDLLATLSQQCVDSIWNKEYSDNSKLPFKVATFVNAMNWRMKECSEAAILLLESDYTHPSLMLIRSAMENAAITQKLATIVRDVVEKKTIAQDDDDDLMRILLGNSYRKDDPFTYPEDEKFKAERIGRHIKRVEEFYPGFQRCYGYLCEFVHPNADGVIGSFSKLDEEGDCTSFGPQLDSSHGLYGAFTITLVLALTIYNDLIEYIGDNLQDFIRVCEMDIIKKAFSK